MNGRKAFVIRILYILNENIFCFFFSSSSPVGNFLRLLRMSVCGWIDPIILKWNANCISIHSSNRKINWKQWHGPNKRCSKITFCDVQENATQFSMFSHLFSVFGVDIFYYHTFQLQFFILNFSLFYLIYYEATANKNRLKSKIQS